MSNCNASIRVAFTTVLVSVLCLSGCLFRKPVSTLRFKGTDMTSWRDRSVANPVPGMTEARVWRVATEDGKHVLLIWGDFEQTTPTKDSWSVGGGQIQSETIVSKDGRRLEWQCELKDDVFSITINQQSFDLSQGTLFLVSTGKTTKVSQLKRDTHSMKLDEEPLKALAQQDGEIEEFFLEGQRRNNKAQ